MSNIKRLAAIFLLILSTHSAATDRAWRSLTTGIAQADAIVVAKVISVIAPPSSGEYIADVELISSLKGAVKDPHLSLRLERHLGRESLDAGGMYILFLAKNGVPPQPFELMGNMTKPHEERIAEEIATLVKLMPQWSRPEAGVSIIAVPDKFIYKVGDNIDLDIGYKNTGAAGAVLRYRDWPLEAHSYWSVDVRLRDGAAVPALPHPHLTADQITDYFSKNGNSFDWSLKPGESFFYAVNKIDSAAPGWGYKERLDFKYYPIRKPGRYTIRVTSHNLYGTKALTAEPFTILVE